jgi:hypothetical protein
VHGWESRLRQSLESHLRSDPRDVLVVARCWRVKHAFHNRAGTRCRGAILLACWSCRQFRVLFFCFFGLPGLYKRFVWGRTGQIEARGAGTIRRASLGVREHHREQVVGKEGPGSRDVRFRQSQVRVGSRSDLPWT